MASETRWAETQVELSLPPCTLRQDDLIEIARRMQNSVGESASSSFSVKGRDYSVSVESSDNFKDVDWPEGLSSAWFNIHGRERGKRIRFSLRGGAWGGLVGEMEISATDVVWVRGVAAEFERFFERHPNPLGLLSHPIVGAIVWVVGVACVIGAASAGLYAADEHAFERTTRIVIIVGAWVGTSLYIVPGFAALTYLFPRIDVRLSGERKMRRAVLGALGALLIAVVANYVAAGLSVLWR